MKIGFILLAIWIISVIATIIIQEYLNRKRFTGTEGNVPMPNENGTRKYIPIRIVGSKCYGMRYNHIREMTIKGVRVEYVDGVYIRKDPYDISGHRNLDSAIVYHLICNEEKDIFSMQEGDVFDSKEDLLKHL